MFQRSRRSGPETDPDADLLAAYAAGDLSAARTLARRLGPGALAQATRMLADRTEAEDVVQEAMLRLWRQAPGWRTGEAKVSTWLYRVVANLCTDRLRARRRKDVPLEAVAEPEDDRPGALADMQMRTRHAALSAALAELPERQAQAVALRHLEGLGNPEIAAIMDIGVEAVESLTARGKRALAALLAGRKEELGFADD
ncbi:sigma-24 [Oceanicola granulosus HTCC2516]|uniref:Sigma-24 n=1 Tax=Oceanicola granulosus (strain ATCC BAA-861 / DSM 15982 / KCTC 12143 / HTCC2516) TaxID=314256 RepID=Q2C9S5_OCEGH|nr:RNA polymerase sigma factor [Oceanicola granulosus]EAR49425.1 sigma-24 [Oceanicola granulosus HTCC2516]